MKRKINWTNICIGFGLLGLALANLNVGFKLDSGLNIFTGVVLIVFAIYKFINKK